MSSKMLYSCIFLYFIRLYCTLAPPTFIFLFFKISFAKSIRLPHSLFKDSSMRSGIALAALKLLILAKSDSKLLKQQLFNVFLTILENWGVILKLKLFYTFFISNWNLKCFERIIVLRIVMALKYFLIEIRFTSAKIYFNPV